MISNTDIVIGQSKQSPNDTQSASELTLKRRFLVPTPCDTVHDFDLHSRYRSSDTIRANLQGRKILEIPRCERHTASLRIRYHDNDRTCSYTHCRSDLVCLIQQSNSLIAMRARRAGCPMLARVQVEMLWLYIVRHAHGLLYHMTKWPCTAGGRCWSPLLAFSHLHLQT